MAEFVREEDATIVEPRYTAIVQSCENAVDTSRIIPIDSEKVDIKKYLDGLLAIKTAQYSLENRLHELLYKNYSLSQARINATCKIENIENIDNINIELRDVENKISERMNSFSISENWYVQFGLEEPFEPVKPGKLRVKKPLEPYYAKPRLFNKKSVLAQNEERKKKYEEELENYNIKKKEHDAEVADYEEKLRNYQHSVIEFNEKKEQYTEAELRKWQDNLARSDAGFQQLLKERDYYKWAINNPKEYKEQQLKNSYPIIAADLVSKEIMECVDSLKKAFQAENDYLSTGVLFPKYSTLPAVTSMCEYFATGRCTELSGPNGAYNLYESELRSDTIIEKLDIISEKLDDIKRNQYMLYRAIQNVNSQLSRLNSTADNMRRELKAGLSSINNHLSNISDNTAVIAYNAEVTAYYSKRNAELTDSLGYLIALK